MVRTMDLKQGPTLHQGEDLTIIVIMTEVTIGEEDVLKGGVVRGMEINVLVTENQVDLTEEEVTHGGVMIETKNNREYEV